MDIATLFTVFANDEEARGIARTLIEEELAACANILGSCHSIYRWQGKIEESEEVAALFKTRTNLTAKLIARLTELHSYQVPAAVVWPVAEALPAYASWVTDETLTE
jgi:periplasmic divalent cation tolerance protein